MSSSSSSIRRRALASAPERRSASAASRAELARGLKLAASTAGSAAQPTLPSFIATKHPPDPMLAIPRPTTRAECLQEARPCPWASCRHHLLLEVAATKGGDDLRPTTLRLNHPSKLRDLPPGRSGRRPGLAATAAHHVVEQWIDDAVEQLQGMRYTCALDIADDYPDGITERSVGLVLGVSERAARADIDQAMHRWRMRIPCEECGVGAGTPCDTPGGLHQARGRDDEIAALLATRRG